MAGLSYKYKSDIFSNYCHLFLRDFIEALKIKKDKEDVLRLGEHYLQKINQMADKLIK